MVRIGVNIPNELMRRLEPLKPELNISEVCREALTAKVESYEQMMARLNDDSIRRSVEEVWEQEKEFLAVIDVDWEMLGYEDADAWVKAAGWNEWEELQDWLDLCKKRNLPQWNTVCTPFIDGVKEFVDRQVELHERMQQQGLDFQHWLYRRHGGIDYRANEQKYMTAWLSYTRTVWQLVVQRREDHYQRLLEDRRTPPIPTAPDHLFDDAQSPEEPPFQVVPHHAGYAPGVDPLKLNHLIADLDVAEFLAKRERLQ